MEDSNPFVSWKPWYLAQDFRREGKNALFCVSATTGREGIVEGTGLAALDSSDAVGYWPLAPNSSCLQAVHTPKLPYYQAALLECLWRQNWQYGFHQCSLLSHSASLFNSVCLNLALQMVLL